MKEELLGDIYNVLCEIRDLLNGKEKNLEVVGRTLSVGLASVHGEQKIIHDEWGRPVSERKQ